MIYNKKQDLDISVGPLVVMQQRQRGQRLKGLHLVKVTFLKRARIDRNGRRVVPIYPLCCRNLTLNNLLMQKRLCHRGPHHPAPQLLHQAQGQRQPGRLHHDKGPGD